MLHYELGLAWLTWGGSQLTTICTSRSSNKPQLGAPRKIGQGCGFNSFTTNNYKLHFAEYPSGIKVGQDTHAVHLLGPST